jgi:hypothetical protein
MTGFSKQDAIPGMAHFRGSGPVGKTCADCAEFAPYGEERDGDCRTYARITGNSGRTISRRNAACQKFVAKAAPPPKPVAPPPGPALPQKTCEMPNCKGPVDSWAQLCGYHWWELPISQQQRNVAARKEEPPALADAVAAAVRWLQTEGERP